MGIANGFVILKLHHYDWLCLTTYIIALSHHQIKHPNKSLWLQLAMAQQAHVTAADIFQPQRWRSAAALGCEAHHFL